MNPQAFMEFLDQYPPWIKWGIAAWVVFGALLLVGLLTLRQVRADTKSEPKGLSSVPTTSSQVIVAPAGTTLLPSQPDASPTTPNRSARFGFKEYEAQLVALDDRFLQKAEFIKALVGTTVTWDGYVTSVSDRDSTLHLLVKSQAKTGMNALVAVTSEQRAKVFSLRPGDRIRFTGTLSLNVPNFPDIDATDFQLLNP